MKIAPSVYLIMFTLLILSPVATSAQWVEDGFPLAVAPNTQGGFTVLNDGQGGAFVTWGDYRTGSYKVWVQHLDGAGQPLWGPEGLQNPDQSGSQTLPVLATDGDGGVIVVYVEYDIRAQRFDRNGNALWDVDGEPVCTAANSQTKSDVIADGQGGAIITWLDYRTMEWEIYAQHIDAFGTMLWPVDGVPLGSLVASVNGPEIVTDGSGGAIVIWSDQGSVAENDIFAQRIDSNGELPWGVTPRSVSSATGVQIYPDAISDGYGGAFVLWHDRRAAYQVYAQHLYSDGSPDWTLDGEQISDTGGYCYSPRLVTDNEGGFFAAWHQSSAIRLQRVNSSGALALGSSQRIDTGGTASNVDLVADGVGGAFVAWEAKLGADRDIFAQRVDSFLTPIGAADIPICTSADDQIGVRVVSDGAGGAVMVWSDSRNSDTDLYAQRLDRNLYWGWPSPLIASTRDVPGDQGGQIFLAWNASRLDAWHTTEVTSYSVWRAISPAKAANTDAEMRVEVTADRIYYWQRLSTIEAMAQAGYSDIAATLFDSTSVSVEKHYFQVVAHTDDPLVYWASPVASGRSADNLAPVLPLGLSATVSPDPTNLQLAWSPSPETDLAHYQVHRGFALDFVPHAGTLLAVTEEESLVDQGWQFGQSLYYKVAAVDSHENVGPYATLNAGDVSAVGESGLPRVTSLGRNYPNPFNPKTTIAFELPKQMTVNLRILDVSGRLVRVLVDGEMVAGGRNETIWNGCDDTGRRVSSGTYFYRLDAGKYSETRRMALVK